MHSNACVTNSFHRTINPSYSRGMRNGGIKALCAIIVLLSGCAVEEPVRVDGGGQRALVGVSAEEAGGEGWYLVFLPPAAQRQLHFPIDDNYISPSG